DLRVYLRSFVSSGDRRDRDALSFPTRRSSDLELSQPWSAWPRSLALRISIMRTSSFKGYKDQKGMIMNDLNFLFMITLSCYSLLDRKSTRLNSSHVSISYAVFCLTKKN